MASAASVRRCSKSRSAISTCSRQRMIARSRAPARHEPSRGRSGLGMTTRRFTRPRLLGGGWRAEDPRGRAGLVTSGVAGHSHDSGRGCRSNVHATTSSGSTPVTPPRSPTPESATRRRQWELGRCGRSGTTLPWDAKHRDTPSGFPASRSRQCRDQFKPGPVPRQGHRRGGTASHGRGGVGGRLSASSPLTGSGTCCIAASLPTTTSWRPMTPSSSASPPGTSERSTSATTERSGRAGPTLRALGTISLTSPSPSAARTNPPALFLRSPGHRPRDTLTHYRPRDR